MANKSIHGELKPIRMYGVTFHEYSPPAVDVIKNIPSEVIAVQLSSNPDLFHSHVIEELKRKEDINGLDTHVIWHAGNMARRLARKVEDFAIKPYDRLKTTHETIIPLINDKHILWTRIEPIFRNCVGKVLSMNANVEYECIPKPIVGSFTEVKIGNIIVQNRLQNLNEDKVPQISDFYFIKIKA